MTCKLDANHDTPIAEDNLPELAAAYREREAKVAGVDEA